jgi:hypothetical protein
VTRVDEGGRGTRANEEHSYEGRGNVTGVDNTTSRKDSSWVKYMDASETEKTTRVMRCEARQENETYRPSDQGHANSGSPSKASLQVLTSEEDKRVDRWSWSEAKSETRCGDACAARSSHEVSSDVGPTFFGLASAVNAVLDNTYL